VTWRGLLVVGETRNRSRLVSDAYEGNFDVAVLITNDTDLLAPVTLVSKRLQKPVGILNPGRRPSPTLSHAASFVRRIRHGALRASQFPVELRDAKGSFGMPDTWRVKAE
jgi:hypothetical protein